MAVGDTPPLRYSFFRQQKRGTLVQRTEERWGQGVAEEKDLDCGISREDQGVEEEELGFGTSHLQP